MRDWFAIALLAGSWLLGLGYFQPASPLGWLCFLAGGVALLSDIPLRLPGRRVTFGVALMVLPAACIAPLPYKAIPLLLGLGVLLCHAPIPRRWPRRLGRGMVASSGVLIAQSGVLWWYQLCTARTHELPWPLATLPHLAARLLGVDAARDGASVAFRSSLSPHRVAATWELLFDPATVCFVVGGLTLLLLRARGTSRHGATKPLLRSGLILLAASLLWSLLRMSLMIGLVLHMVLRADAVTYPNVGQLLVSTWLHIALLGGIVLLASFLVPGIPRANDTATRGRYASPRRARTTSPLAAPLAMVTAGVAISGGAVLFRADWPTQRGAYLCRGTAQHLGTDD